VSPSVEPRATSGTPSFCRFCPAACGVLVEVVGGQVSAVRGDPEHPVTRGFTCPKGRHLATLHLEPTRFVAAQRRTAVGRLEPVETATAVGEVAARIGAIVAEHGPDAVGLFIGTQAYSGTLTIPWATAWLQALGSHKLFTTSTIDQSAKMVTARRLGWWDGGLQEFDSSDVWMLVGTNPFVTMSGGLASTGFPIHDQSQRVRRARAAGLKLIVVDPRRTETAGQADLHLQLLPGSDSLLLAAMLNVVLHEERHDAAFCAEHVDGLDLLRSAVAQVSPESVADRTGLTAEEIVLGARMFADARQGMARSATGPDMGPWSNLSEHLLQALNVVCGRYPQAGAPFGRAGVLAPPGSRRAQVRNPRRTWESGYRSRLGYGLIGKDLPTATLPDEILVPGADRIRALVVLGGNPASAIPDQRKTVRALSELELLVALEPFASETSQLADYVIAPALQLEREDCTTAWEDSFEEPFAQFTPQLLPPPPGVIEDWAFFADLSRAMHLELTVAGGTHPPGQDRPSTRAALEAMSAGGRLPLSAVLEHPHGRVFDEIGVLRVQEPDGRGGRVRLLPADVAAERVRALRRERLVVPAERPFLLAVRRDRRTMNSLGRRAPSFSVPAANPCSLHPEDLSALGLTAGELVRVSSAHGEVVAECRSDPTLRRGVVTLTHGFGDLPDSGRDIAEVGTNPGLLISLDSELEEINSMPRITAVPVAVQAAAPG
jgi:anaerobic selenocysteine-containing dehydrogenase